MMADSMEALLMAFVTETAQADYGCSPTHMSFVALCVFLGMALGSTFFGYLSDRFGRKKGLFWSMAATAVFGALSALSPNVWWLMLLRALTGIGIGGFHTGVTLYTELLPTHTRSLQLTIIQSFWALGVLLQCVLAWTMCELSWRWLVLATAVPAAISCTTYLLIPESPRFLVLHDRPEEAKKVLLRAAVKNKKLDVLPEAFDLRSGETVTERAGIRDRFAPLVRTAAMRRLTVTVSLVWFTALFSYYGVVFLTAQSSYGISNRYVEHLVVSFAEVPAYVGTFFFSIRFGRKKGMIISSTCTACCMLVLAFQESIPREANFCLMFFCRWSIAIFFALAVLYTPEAFPTSVRATGFGIASTCARIGCMLTPFVAIKVRSVSVLAAAMVYVGVLCVGVISSCLLPFDTSNKSLRENDLSLLSHNDSSLGASSPQVPANSEDEIKA